MRTKKDKAIQFLKQHPQVFDERLPDEEIPDISWLYERNHELLGGYNAPRNTKIEKETNIRPWYALKRVYIPISALLLTVLFVFVTPLGHAVAEGIYNTVIQWVTGEVNISHGKADTPPIEKNIEKSITEFKSIEDIKSKYGFVLASNHNIQSNKIEVESTDTLTIVRSVYDKPNITLTQKIMKYDTEWSSTIDTNEGQIINVKLPNGIKFIGNLNNSIGFALAYKDNMSIEVYSENIEYNDFIGFIENIKFE